MTICLYLNGARHERVVNVELGVRWAGCKGVCVVSRVRVWVSVDSEARPRFSQWLGGMINKAG